MPLPKKRKKTEVPALIGRDRFREKFMAVSRKSGVSDSAAASVAGKAFGPSPGSKKVVSREGGLRRQIMSQLQAIGQISREKEKQRKLKSRARIGSSTNRQIRQRKAGGY